MASPQAPGSWNLRRLTDVLVSLGASKEQAELAIAVSGVKEGSGPFGQAVNAAANFLVSQGVQLNPPESSGTGDSGGRTVPSGKLSIKVEAGMQGQTIQIRLPDGRNLPFKVPLEVPTGAVIELTLPSASGPPPATRPVQGPVNWPGTSCPRKCQPGMFPSEVLIDGVSCDICKKKIPRRGAVLSCRNCDYDICQNCAMKKIHEFKTKPETEWRKKKKSNGFKPPLSNGKIFALEDISQAGSNGYRNDLMANDALRSQNFQRAASEFYAATRELKQAIQSGASDIYKMLRPLPLDTKKGSSIQEGEKSATNGIGVQDRKPGTNADQKPESHSATKPVEGRDLYGAALVAANNKNADRVQEPKTEASKSKDSLYGQASFLITETKEKRNEGGRNVKKDELHEAIPNPYSEANTLTSKILDVAGAELGTVNRDWGEVGSNKRDSKNEDDADYGAAYPIYGAYQAGESKQILNETDDTAECQADESDLDTMGILKKGSLNDGKMLLLPLDELPNPFDAWSISNISSISSSCSISNARTCLAELDEKGKKRETELQNLRRTDPEMAKASEVARINEMKKDQFIIEFKYPVMNYDFKLTVEGREIPRQTRTWFGREIKKMPSRPVNQHFQLIRDQIMRSQAQIENQKHQFKAFCDQVIEFQLDILCNIVDEYYLPPPIKRWPFPCGAGGLAGGEKFHINGMLVKFAIDSNGIFGSDEGASKVAMNEIRHLSVAHDVGVANLHYPFTYAFRFWGFTLILTAIAPLSGDGSLVYGSADATKSIHCSKQCEEMVKELAKKLNLAKHPVAALDQVGKDGKREVEELWLAADIEGHYSKLDGRFYLIDMARLMPPCPPRRNAKADHLVRLFRAEFLKEHCKTPLSSDIFTRFGALERKTLWVDGYRAFTHLCTTVVPKVLDFIYLQVQGGLELDISKASHKFGVNLRYLGHLYSLAWKRKHFSENENDKNAYKNICEMLMEEMTMRVLKRNLGTCMRRTGKELSDVLFSLEWDSWKKHTKKLKKEGRKLPKLEEIASKNELQFTGDTFPKEKLDKYRELLHRERKIVLVTYLRLLIGSDPTSNEFWNNIIFNGVRSKYDLGRDDLKQIRKPWWVTPKDLKQAIHTVRGRVGASAELVARLLKDHQVRLFEDSVNNARIMNLIALLVRTELPHNQRGSQDQRHTNSCQSISLQSCLEWQQQVMKVAMDVGWSLITVADVTIPIFQPTSNVTERSLLVFMKQLSEVTGVHNPVTLTPCRRLLELYWQSSIQESERNQLDDGDDDENDHQSPKENVKPGLPDGILDGMTGLTKPLTHKVTRHCLTDSKARNEIILFLSSMVKPLTEAEKKRVKSFIAEHKERDPITAPSIEKMFSFYAVYDLKKSTEGQRNIPKFTEEERDHRRIIMRELQIAQRLLMYMESLEAQFFGSENNSSHEMLPKPNSKLMLDGDKYASKNTKRRLVYWENALEEVGQKLTACLYFKHFDFATLCVSMAFVRHCLVVGHLDKVHFWLTHAVNSCDRMNAYQMKVQVLKICIEYIDAKIEHDPETMMTYHAGAVGAYHNLAVGYEQIDAKMALQAYEEGLRKATSIKAFMGKQWAQMKSGDNFDNATMENPLPKIQSAILSFKMKIAGVYGKMGNWQEKARRLKEMKEDVVQFYGDIHRETANLFNSLGEATCALGKYTEAQEYLVESIQIGRTIGFVPSHHLYNLANLYSRYRRQDVVIEILEEAVKFDEQRLGKDSIKITSTLRKLAQEVGVADDYERQLAIMKRVIGIFEKHGITHGKEYAFALQNMGIAIMDKALRLSGFDPLTGKANNVGDTYNQLKDAKKICTKGLEVLKRSLDEKHPDVGVLMSNLGNIVGYMGENEYKLELQNRSLEITLAKVADNHPEVATTLSNIGKTLFTLGRYEDAEQKMQRAYNIQVGHFGPQHPASQWMSRRLDEIRTMKDSNGRARGELAETLANQGVGRALPDADNEDEGPVGAESSPYATQLEQIKAMGIQKSDQVILQTLASANGDINTAIAMLFS